MLTMQVFAFNTLFGIIFAILSWATFSVRLSHTLYLDTACLHSPDAAKTSQDIVGQP